MKRILLSALLLGQLNTHAQWQGTSNFTSMDCITAFGNVYASNVSDNVVQVSNDEGSSWTNSNTGIPASGVNFGLFNSGNLYAYRSNTIFVTSTGNNWTAMSGAITNTDIVRAVTAQSGTLFAGTSPFSGTSFKVYQNSGSSWTLKSSFTGTILTGLKSMNGALYAATTATGVLKSTNNGQTFSPSSTGIPNNSLDKYISAIGNSSSALFAGTSGGKILRSTDNGANWTTVHNMGDGASTVYVNDIYVMINGVILVASDSGFVYSSNGGTTWTKYNNGLNYSNFENQIRKITVVGSHIVAAVSTMVGGKIMRLPLATISVGINEHALTTLVSRAFPNPSADNFEIMCEDLLFETNCEVLITDMLGKEVHRGILSNGVFTVNLSNQTSGVYCYSILRDGLSVTHGKLIKN